MAQELVNIYNDILNEIKYHIEVSKTKLEITNDVVICDERSFQGWFLTNELTPTTIYIIVSFEEGEIWFGNTVVPLSFTVYSEQETFETTRLLLTYFANAYNFVSAKGTNNATIIQSYSIPTMREEFVEDGNSYRAIFDMSATFVYGENVSGITSIVINDEEITFLNASSESTTIVNSANLGDKNNRTTTLNQSMTFTLALSFPSTLESPFVKDIDELHFGSKDINTIFNVSITKGNKTYTKKLKCISIAYEQEITGIPMYAVGLGE